MKRAFTKTSAAVGMALILLSAGASDYYVLALRQREPKDLQSTLILGVLLTVPYLLQKAKDFIRRKVIEWLLQG